MESLKDSHQLFTVELPIPQSLNTYKLAFDYLKGIFSFFKV